MTSNHYPPLNSDFSMINLYLSALFLTGFPRLPAKRRQSL